MQGVDGIGARDMTPLCSRGLRERIVAYINVNRVRREHYLCLMRQGNMARARMRIHSGNWIFNGNKYSQRRASAEICEDYADAVSYKR